MKKLLFLFIILHICTGCSFKYYDRLPYSASRGYLDFYYVSDGYMPTNPSIWHYGVVKDEHEWSVINMLGKKNAINKDNIIANPYIISSSYKNVRIALPPKTHIFRVKVGTGDQYIAVKITDNMITPVIINIDQKQQNVQDQGSYILTTYSFLMDLEVCEPISMANWNKRRPLVPDTLTKSSNLTISDLKELQKHLKNMEKELQ